MVRKKKQKLLPSSISSAAKSAGAVALAAAVMLIGLSLAIALIFRDSSAGNWFSTSTGYAGNFITNISGFVAYAVGWIPAMFAFLYIVRSGFFAMLRQADEAPEYNALRAVAAIIFGSFGFGITFSGYSFGGLFGSIAAKDLVALVGNAAIFAGLVFIALFVLMAAILLHVKWSDVKTVFKMIFKLARWMSTALRLTHKPVPEEEEEVEIEEFEQRTTNNEQRSALTKRKSKRQTANHESRTTNHDFELPPPELMEKSIFAQKAVTPELRRNAISLETHFQEFGVYGKVAGIKPGPIVTLYEFEPDSGMRIAKITDTVKDMTRAMAAENIRIAHIPRTNYIGVELVNLDRQTVRMRSLIESQDFVNSKYRIPLALGVDIGGHPVYFDLAKMPHVLIAGRTGSGKSVFVQSIIMSVLYHFTPDKCKLAIIDPKGVDFTLWRDIPHLVTPVVTDANQAVNVLKWTVREMEDRYKRLKKVGAQNLEGYNEEVERLRESGKTMTESVATGTDPETGELEFEEREVDLSDMPYLVVIVDEVADLMSVARKEVEASVQRLAQKARAAGIHLVLATQRPDTSVITGVIKANFPTRISFQARSNIDSMTTLGEKGAEQLLAFGDMLFSEAGRVPVRIHGSFVENKEINRVADFLRDQGTADYVEGVGDAEEEESAEFRVQSAVSRKAEKDGDMYSQAVEYVVRDKKPTISYIQRRLGIGYNKAATFIERMEQEGIVSAPDANNKRHIL